MLRFDEVVEGESYRNKKNGNIYTLTQVSVHTEGLHQVFAHYTDETEYPWTRELGLFMVKFEAVNK